MRFLPPERVMGEKKFITPRLSFDWQPDSR
jgi:hypothetical protein